MHQVDIERASGRLARLISGKRATGDAQFDERPEWTVKRFEPCSSDKLRWLWHLNGRRRFTHERRTWRSGARTGKF